MTLIEMMVALAVVGVMFSAAVMGVGALTGSKARGATGELAGIIRSLYDTASLSGKTCRLVFDLGNARADGDDAPPVKYWAECAAGAVTAGRDRESPAGSKGRPERSESKPAGFSGASPTLQDLVAQEKERVESAATYASFTSPEVPRRELPSSVRVSVWTRHQRVASESGLASLYFFPQGFTERAMVFISQGSNVWTVTVSPLTGKTAVVGERLEVPSS
ncbi:MAG TPA: prepilin-type N-terminal cleavage/methylation domain-containing protein [Myxococcaceae bacterium]|nr:prepilin-type N-terminal cleavage/methylation domain-containing protein [Myxococcaceae bacterium]